MVDSLLESIATGCWLQVASLSEVLGMDDFTFAVYQNIVPRVARLKRQEIELLSPNKISWG